VERQRSAVALIRKLATKLGRVTRRLKPARWRASAPHPVLAEALGPLAASGGDMHDHFGVLFYEAVASHPRLLVELGTRGGASTRALLAAAEICDAHLVSVDLEDCSGIALPDRFRRRWTFVQADDITFSGQPFEAFCRARGLPPRAELILVDTSHEYDHTRAEVAAWLPRLASRGAILFHDTNMGSGWFRRLDGKVEPGWDNRRGVIRVLEDLLGRRYDESTHFADAAAGFAVRHVPRSSGLTVLRRLG
jgi:hypothetical protein